MLAQLSPLQSEVLSLPDDHDAIFDRLYDLGVTDGFPVIPPTDERVERFIAASGRSARTVIAEVPPDFGVATVESIAINAVMAGCRPEYMPVLIAAVEAVCEPAFNLLGIQATTNPVAPLLLINGPIRKQLDVNCGRNALGPGRRANATIGRAMRLIQLNIGGAVPDTVDKATLGMPGKYTLCLGELEEDSPWDPLHVDRGCRRDESAVTVVGVQGTDNILAAWKEADGVTRAVGSAMASLAANNTTRGGNTIVIMPPGHAKLLAAQGLSKRDVQGLLFEHSKLPLSVWPKEIAWADDLRHPNVEDGYFTAARRPEDILIAVAGGPEAYHITYCASFGDWAVTKPIKPA